MHLFEPTAPDEPTPPPAGALAAALEPAGGRPDWSALAPGVGLAPDAPVLVALSGGADSVLLLDLVAAAVPARRVLAVHVDHGLRGAESEADARFCADLCRSLGVPHRVVPVALDADAPGLEERARRARYRALAEVAAQHGHATVATAHHADDSLETLLQRWIRGDAVEGLCGPRRELALPAGSDLNPTARPLRLVRPLLAHRRGEIRRWLQESGRTWREDTTNLDPRFTRNRIRHRLIPALSDSLGEDAVPHLEAFGDAVRRLEDDCARRTAHLVWRPARLAGVGRGPAEGPGSLELPRGELAALPGGLQRRALWRLLAEATGRGPGRALLAQLVDDVARARCTRRRVGRGWMLVLRAASLVLVPPRPATTGPGELPFPLPSSGETPGSRSLDAALPVPGEVRLLDGRRITARVVVRAADAPPPRDPWTVELDARRLDGGLRIRFARPGDRLRPLGAPGTRRLVRFLADAGVPREERGHVPLVVLDRDPTAIVWVAGVRPAHDARIGPDARRRVELRLEPPLRRTI